MSEASWLAAAKAGKLAKLKQLLGASAEPAKLCAHKQPGVSSAGHSALHWASAGGHTDVVCWLLEQEGVSVDAVNHGGSSPLHSACANGHAAIVRRLVAAGADAARTDCNGDTPLVVAAARGHADAARALLGALDPACASAHVYMRLSVGGRPLAGSMVFRLQPQSAPRACANFVGLAEGFRGASYRGNHFHRLLPGQVLQGGELRANGSSSIFGRYFNDEAAGLQVEMDGAGLLCMANSGPNSNGSQFFVTLAPTPHLNGRHVVFGKLVSGHELLSAAGTVPPREKDDRPSVPIAITECGRWPPAAAEAVEGSSGGGGAEVEAAMTLGEAASESDATQSAVASAVTAGLKRAREEESQPGGGTTDGTSVARQRPSDAAALSTGSRWDTLGAFGGDEGDESSSGEEDGG